MSTEVVVENKKWVRKTAYWGRLQSALDEYKNILVINVDFVGSNQLQKARIALRGKAIILMGKNTMIRKVLRERLEATPQFEALMPSVRGNIGFVFTNGDLNEIRAIVTENKVPAGAKAGVIAPIDVVIPPGPTGLDPGQTNFFQTLNIGTKIVKGTIEIISASKVCTKGLQISSSAVALLNKLGIRPFEYGIVVSTIYENGSVYDVKVLDMGADDIGNMFVAAANKLAALSFALGQINQATVPHSFGRAFKALVSVALSADYNFDEIKEIKEMLANPGAFAAPAAGGAKPVAAAIKAPEPEPEEEAAPAVDLFGGAKKGGDY